MKTPQLLTLHNGLSTLYDTFKSRNDINAEGIAEAMVIIEREVKRIGSPIQPTPSFGAELEAFAHSVVQGLPPAGSIEGEVHAVAKVGERMGTIVPSDMGFIMILRGGKDRMYFITSLQQKVAINVLREFINAQEFLGL